jgi:type IV pilus assembly protein PilC
MSPISRISRRASPARKSWWGLSEVISEWSAKRRLAQQRHRDTIHRREVTYIMRNLATLIDNGVSLQKALGTLAREESLRAHSSVLDDLRRRIEVGETFSTAMSRYPNAFDTLVIHQIRIGEKAGTLATSLLTISEQLEKAGSMRAAIIKKLAYPVVLMIVGALAIGFMLLFVIPVFQDTYDSAGVPLPGITLALLWTADAATTFGPYFLLIPAIGILALKYISKRPALAVALDRSLLRIPMLGSWLRDMAVLQFMDVLSTLLESGFTVVEALGESANAVRNRAVQDCIRSLEAAVRRGERFSRELDRYSDLFPPVVGQLVIIGETTGNLPRATRDIREHLRREIERKTNIAVGTIEPVLTISLATLIGIVLLAIYLPMFDMISTMG